MVEWASSAHERRRGPPRLELGATPALPRTGGPSRRQHCTRLYAASRSDLDSCSPATRDATGRRSSMPRTAAPVFGRRAALAPASSSLGLLRSKERRAARTRPPPPPRSIGVGPYDVLLAIAEGKPWGAPHAARVPPFSRWTLSARAARRLARPTREAPAASVIQCAQRACPSARPRVQPHIRVPHEHLETPRPTAERTRPRRCLRARRHSKGCHAILLAAPGADPAV